jgi:hypothetical protein
MSSICSLLGSTFRFQASGMLKTASSASLSIAKTPAFITRESRTFTRPETVGGIVVR